jgi:hypothetical protein
MRVFNSTLLLLAAVLISACASVEPVSNARLAWIDYPGNGVSVSAGMHVAAGLHRRSWLFRAGVLNLLNVWFQYSVGTGHFNFCCE